MSKIHKTNRMRKQDNSLESNIRYLNYQAYPALFMMSLVFSLGCFFSITKLEQKEKISSNPEAIITSILGVVSTFSTGYYFVRTIELINKNLN
jgi:fluoride ion exporter CrcB/FEX